MKPDMHKIIIETGRVGGDLDHHRRQRSKVKQMLHEEKFDEIPLRESVKPKLPWGDLKEQNDNLNPLKRFLEKNFKSSDDVQVPHNHVYRPGFGWRRMLINGENMYASANLDSIFESDE